MKTVTVVALLAAILLLCSAELAAKPAAWWRWQGQVDGSIVCKQSPPGPGWKAVAGPFHNSRCEN